MFARCKHRPITSGRAGIKQLFLKHTFFFEGFAWPWHTTVAAVATLLLSSLSDLSRQVGSPRAGERAGRRPYGAGLRRRKRFRHEEGWWSVSAGPESGHGSRAVYRYLVSVHQPACAIIPDSWARTR